VSSLPLSSFVGSLVVFLSTSSCLAHTHTHTLTGGSACSCTHPPLQSTHSSHPQAQKEGRKREASFFVRPFRLSLVLGYAFRYVCLSVGTCAFLCHWSVGWGEGRWAVCRSSANEDGCKCTCMCMRFGHFMSGGLLARGKGEVYVRRIVLLCMYMCVYMCYVVLCGGWMDGGVHCIRWDAGRNVCAYFACT